MDRKMKALVRAAQQPGFVLDIACPGATFAYTWLPPQTVFHPRIYWSLFNLTRYLLVGPNNEQSTDEVRQDSREEKKPPSTIVGFEP
jgi:hypothetical protein